MKKRAFSPPDLDAFATRLSEETDRACGVLGAALLDASLEDLVRGRLQSRGDELLGQNRPLGSFSSRISLASALSWIEDDVTTDLDTIRSIRNDFAHSFDHALAFSDQSIAARCSNLVSSLSFLEGISAAAPHNPNFSVQIFDAMRSKFSAPRWRFQLAVELLYQLLRDLPRATSVYGGPSIRSEAFKLAAGTRLRLQATAIVGLPPEASRSDQSGPNKAAQQADAAGRPQAAGG